MDPSPQKVRTRGPARPRNLAVGCLAALVVLAALMVLGQYVRGVESETEASSVEARP